MSTLPSTDASNAHHGWATAQNTAAKANIQNDSVIGWCRCRACLLSR